jgi:hypothetical protein
LENCVALLFRRNVGIIFIGTVGTIEGGIILIGIILILAAGIISRGEVHIIFIGKVIGQNTENCENNKVVSRNNGQSSSQM